MTSPASLVRPVAVYYDVLDFQPETLAALRQRFDLIVRPSPEHDGDLPWDAVRVLFAPMGFRFDAARLSLFPRLIAVGSPTTGVPHIDVEFAAANGVAICSLRHEQPFLSTITPTAELAWGLLLAVCRRIPWAVEMVRDGRWDGKALGRQTPRMLSTMRLGVVGLGRLGSMVAKYGHAFGMRVQYYDPYIEDSSYVKAKSLDALASSSDVVSLHVHSTNETRDMIGTSFFDAMPPGGFFINTARGDLVDESALIAALESGRLAGAGLDTIRDEHLPGFRAALERHPLIRYAKSHENLVLTPHCGGCTRDAWQRTELRIVSLIDEALEAQTTS